MNKKAGLLETIIVGIILIIVLVILIAVFTGQFNTFNPEEDICLETDETGCKVQNAWMDKTPSNNKFYCFEYEFQLGCPMSACSTHNDCVDWRSKTPCELNPNSEGCVCDESKNCKDLLLTGFSDLCLQNLDNCNDDEMDLVHNYWDCLLDKPCLKAHDPNECEKSNPDWILGEDNFRSADGYTFHCFSDDECGTNRTICRKKTIYDQSCEDLKRAIHLGSPYCTSENVFRGNTLSHTCYSDLIYIDEIYDIAIEKGCEI